MTRFYPFANGTQWDAWEARNCDRCTKSALDDSSWAVDCTLLNAIFMSQIECDGVDTETAQRMGYDDTALFFSWDCTERELKVKS